MSRTISLFVISMLMATAWSSPTKEDLEFQDFLQALHQGFKRPISKEYIVKQHFDHNDIDIPSLFSLLSQLAGYVPENLEKTSHVLSGLSVVFEAFWKKRGGDMVYNLEISSVIPRTLVTLQDGVDLLRQVRKNGLESSLMEVGNVINTDKNQAGQLFGMILEKSQSTTLGLFVHGLADGIDSPIEMEYLVRNYFNNETIRIHHIIDNLLILTNVSHRSEADVNLAIHNIALSLCYLKFERENNFVVNESLIKLYAITWPIFTYPGSLYKDFIQKQGLVNRLSEVGTQIPEDIENAGRILGRIFKIVSELIKKNKSQANNTPGKLVSSLIRRAL